MNNSDLINSVIVKAVNLPDYKGPDRALVDQLVPDLFRKKLHKKSSVAGKIALLAYRWKICKPQPRWRRILKEALIEPPKVEDRKAAWEIFKLRMAYQVDQRPEHRSPIPQLFKDHKSLSPESGLKQVSANSQQVKELSWIYDIEPKKIENYKKSLYQALFGDFTGKELPNQAILEDLRERLPSSVFNTLAQRLAPAFAKEKAFSKLLASRDENRVKQYANDLYTSVAELSKGKSTLIITGVHAQCQNIGSLLAQWGLIPTENENMFNPKDLQEMVQGIVEQSLTPIQDKLDRVLLKKIKKKFNDFVHKGITETFANAYPISLEALTPSTLQNLCYSLCSAVEEDYKKEIFEELGIKKKEDQEKIRARIKEFFSGELKELLNESIQKMLFTKVHALENRLRGTVAIGVGTLPPLATELLHTLGGDIITATDQPLWIEITKQNDGRYTLNLYASETALWLHQELDGGYSLPRTWENLTLEQLDETFFYRLATYRIWPQWHSDCSYSIKDFEKSLLAPLGDPVEVKENELKKEKFQNGLGPFGYYLTHHLPECDTWFLERRVEAFKELFGHYLANEKVPPKLLYNGSKKIVENAQQLYKEEKITLQVLQQAFATHLEIKALFPNVDEIQLPEELKTFTKKLGSNQKLILSLKSVLIKTFGSSLERVIDEALTEIVPTLSAHHLPKEQETMHELSLNVIMRLLLHAATLGSYGIVVSIIASIVHRLLRVFSQFYRENPLLKNGMALKALLPLYQIKQLLEAGLVRPILAIISPLFAHLMLPEPVLRDLNHCILWVKETAVSYAIKILIQAILNKKQITQLHKMAHDLSQTLTKAGEVSYTLPSPVISKGKKAVPNPIRATLSEVKSLTEATDEDLFVDQFVHMNQLIRSFPIPKKGEKDAWDEEKDPRSRLEILGQLALIVHQQYERSRQISVTFTCESILSLLSLFTIMDKLARRCEEACLDGFSTQPMFLYSLLEIIDFSLADPQSEKKFLEVCSYFEIDVSKNYQEGLKEIKKKNLFNQDDKCFLRKKIEDLNPSNFNALMERIFDEFNYETELFKYCRRLLSNNGIEKRLETETSSIIDTEKKKIRILCEDFARLDLSDQPLTQKKGFIPRPFYLLWVMYELCSKRFNYIYIPLAEVRTPHGDLDWMEKRGNQAQIMTTGFSESNKILLMTQCFKPDEVVSIFSYFSHPDRLPSIIELDKLHDLEKLALQPGLFVRQADECREFVEAAVQFFYKALSYCVERKKYAKALGLLKVAYLCKCRTPSNQWPIYTSWMEKNLTKQSQCADYHALFALFSELECDETDMLQAFLIAKMQKNYLDKELQHLFALHFAKRKDKIKTDLNDNLDVRKKALNTVARSMKKEISANVHWQGKYPQFSCPTLVINFADQSITAHPIVSQIEKDARSRFGRKCDTPVVKGTQTFEIPNLGIVAELSADSQSVTYKKLHQKRWYTLVKHIPGTSYWNDPEQKKILRFFHDDKKTAIMPSQSIHEGHESHLGLIQLDQIEHGLSLLSWFCPPKQMKVFRSVDHPNRVEQIQLYDLEFNVRKCGEELKAYADDAFSRFYIAKKQKHPALRPYPSSLLIQNDEGEAKALIRCENFLGVIATALSSHVNLANPYLSQWVASHNEEEEANYFIYDINDQGKLTSSDPDAIAYLLLFNLAQGDRKAIRETLSKMELSSRIAPFNQRTFSFLKEAQMIATQRDSAIFLQIASMCQENRYLQPIEPVKRKNEEYVIHLIFLFFTQWQLITERENRELGALPSLDEYRELLLLAGIVRDAKELMNELGSEKFQMIKDGIHFIGLEGLIDYICLMPELASRYKDLLRQFSMEDEVVESTLEKLYKLIPTKAISTSVNPIPRSPITCLINRIAIPMIRDLGNSQFCKEKLGRSDHLLKEDKKLLLKKYQPNTTDQRVPIELFERHPEWVVDYFVPYCELLSNDDENFIPMRSQLTRMLNYSRIEKGTPAGRILKLLQDLSAVKSFHYTDIKKIEEKFEQGEEAVSHFIDSLESDCSFQLGIRNTFSGKTVKEIVQYFAPGIAKGILTRLTGVGLLFDIAKVARVGIHLHENLIIYTDRENRIAQEREERKQNLKQSVAVLDSSWATQLQTQEDIIAPFLSKFYAQSFQMEKQNVVRSRPFAPTENECSSLNESLQQFTKRPIGEQHKLKGMEASDWHAFRYVIDELSLGIRCYLEKGKEEMLAFVNQLEDTSLDTEQGIMHAIAGQKVPPSPLDWDQLLDLFAKQNRKLWEKKCILSDAEISRLNLALYSWLVLATRHQQLERIKKLLNQSDWDPTCLDKLGAELSWKRVYSFSETPATLLKAYLLLEYHLGMPLWQKPVEQYERLLLRHHEQAVLELQMGMGKTTRGTPTVSYFEANGSQLVINIHPEPVVKTHTEMIALHGKMLGQDAYRLQFTRQRNLKRDDLWALLRLVNHAKECGEQLNMVKEDLQGLELMFIEELDKQLNGKGTGDQKQKLYYYKEILKAITQFGVGNVDEYHEVMDPKLELNYPIGTKKGVDRSYIRIIAQCVEIVAEYKPLDVINGNQHLFMLQKGQYQKEVKPLLAKKAAAFTWGGLEENQRGDLQEYFLAETETIPKWIIDHPKRSQFALVKGMINTLLPAALSDEVNVDYNPSKQENGDYTRPSDGNDNPKENAEIKNPYMAILKSFFMLLHRRPSKSQVASAMKVLLKKAKGEAKRKRIDPDQTSWGQFYSKISKGSMLSSYKACDINILKKSDLFTNFVVEHVIAPQVQFYSRNLCSNPQNFGSQFRRLYGCTGTPDQPKTYPLNTQILYDEGTAGESIAMLRKQCQGENPIEWIAALSPDAILLEVIQQFCTVDTPISAIIDPGALFRGISNRTVAKRLMLLSEAQGVVFYNDAKEKMIWEKGADAPIPLEQSRLPLEKRLTYFDQSHTYAADITQHDHAKALILMSETTTFTQFMQGMWRMRQLKRGSQKIVVGAPKRLQMKIKEVDDLITFLYRNDLHKVKPNHYRAELQKIQNVLRREHIRKLIFAENVDAMLAVAPDLIDTLITHTVTDPFELWGWGEKKSSPDNVLEKQKRQVIQFAESNLHYIDDEVEALKKEIRPLGKGVELEEITTYVKDGKTVLGNDHELDQTVIVAVAQNVDDDADVDEEQELEQQQEFEVHQNAPEESLNHRPPQLWNWSDRLDIKTLDWTEIKPVAIDRHVVGAHVGIGHVPLFKLSDAVSYATNPHINAIANAFSGNLFCTNNFIPLYRSSFYETMGDATDLFQKPLLQVLVIWHKAHLHVGAIDLHDGDYWRRRLKRDREEASTSTASQLAIYDVALRTVVSCSANSLTNAQLHKNRLFNRSILQLKFFSGCVTYNDGELNILKPWIQKNNPKKMELAFKQIWSRHNCAPYIGSDIEYLFSTL